MGLILFSKKKIKDLPFEYDPNKQKAVLRCSICNGEQVAGFKDKETGHFVEVMYVKNGQDIDEFMEMYNLATITKEY